MQTVLILQSVPRSTEGQGPVGTASLHPVTQQMCVQQILQQWLSILVEYLNHLESLKIINKNLTSRPIPRDPPLLGLGGFLCWWVVKAHR